MRIQIVAICILFGERFFQVILCLSSTYIKDPGFPSIFPISPIHIYIQSFRRSNKLNLIHSVHVYRIWFILAHSACVVRSFPSKLYIFALCYTILGIQSYMRCKFFVGWYNANSFKENSEIFVQGKYFSIIHMHNMNVVEPLLGLVCLYIYIIIQNVLVWHSCLCAHRKLILA